VESSIAVVNDPDPDPDPDPDHRSATGLHRCEERNDVAKMTMLGSTKIGLINADSKYTTKARAVDGSMITTVVIGSRTLT
jgi:hypothetical protein